MKNLLPSYLTFFWIIEIQANSIISKYWNNIEIISKNISIFLGGRYFNISRNIELILKYFNIIQYIQNIEINKNPNLHGQLLKVHKLECHMPHCRRIPHKNHQNQPQDRINKPYLMQTNEKPSAFVPNIFLNYWNTS